MVKKSLSRFYSYPYFAGTLMIRLGQDVLTLSVGLSSFCFIGVSGLGFGGLAVTLVSGISTGTDAPSSLRRSFCSRWSGVISRDWLDMDPVSGILVTGYSISFLHQSSF